MAESFRYFVNRDGIEVDELFATTAGDIRCDMDADISRSLSVNFMDSELFNPLKDEFSVYMDGTRLGIFMVGTLNKMVTKAGIENEIEAYDRSYILQQTKLESRLFYDSGTGYGTIVGSIVSGHGFHFVLDKTDDILQSSREWDIGTSELDIINELLDEINFRHIWFDNNGVAHMSKKTDPDFSKISAEYNIDNLKSIPMLSDMGIETDIFDIPNVIMAICDNPDYEESMIATAENINPYSSVSIPNRGRRIVEIFNLDNVASQEILQSFAVALMNAYSSYSESVSIQTIKNNPVNPGDTVSLIHPALEGLFIESGWSMSLSKDGLMSHTLKRSRLA